MADSVCIIGGGLAGLAAATALAPYGFDVSLLESRGRLGGRAGSFQDAVTGQLLDTCQHVSMGCCTNFAHFCRRVGINNLLQPQQRLHFMTPDCRMSVFRADPVPAPLHLARSFWNAHYLTFQEKLRIALGLVALGRSPAEDDPPFHEWLLAHRQTQRAIDRFWGMVLTSALNETPDRIGLRYARKVFVDGFLRHRRGFEICLPTVPLGRLYGAELLSWLEKHGVQLTLNASAKEVRISGSRVDALAMRHGENIRATWYITAVPFDRLLDLLPLEVSDAHECFRNLRCLETSPITSVHLWYDRPILDVPHVTLVDCIGQWVFNRGKVAGGEYYLQVVVSASRQFRGLKHEEVEQRIVAELAGLFPQALPAALRRARVITEHGATFSAVPGVDRWRPRQDSPLSNLFLAGDWTATGWPATMEGAVRSGYLAAEALLRRVGREESLIQPDL
jgi:squalene-associated FAD-dependent desaturase